MTIKLAFLMRKLKYILLVLFGFCQNSVIDSLVMALNKTNNDIDKVQLLNALADEYKVVNPKLVLTYGQKALLLSRKIKYKLAEGNAFLNIGNGNVIVGNYALALQSFSNAQIIFQELSETSSDTDKEAIDNGLAKSYGSIAIVFSEQSNYSKSLSYNLKAVQIYEANGNLDKSVRIYNNIGIVYESQGDYFKALDYFVKCLKIQQKTGKEITGIQPMDISL